MLLSSMISNLGIKIDRSDQDAYLKREIDNAVKFLFNVLGSDKLIRKVSKTTTADQSYILIPDDCANLLYVGYVPGDGTGYDVTILADRIFNQRYTDNTLTLSNPDFVSVIDNKLYIYPIPSEAYTLDLTYTIKRPCIYTHNLSVIHDASAATNGVAVYVDEDGEDNGVGKLYFVSPTDTDGKVALQMADGHVHTVTVYDSDSAATLGVQMYLDEDGNNSDSAGYQRALFVSPTGKDCVIRTDVSRGHFHYIYITDNPNAASTGVAVYLDEDATTKGNRLLFVSPTTTNGSLELALTEDGRLSPFLENYDEAIQAKACIEAFVPEKDWNAVNTYKETLKLILGNAGNQEQRNRPVSIDPTSFGMDNARLDPLKYPTISGE